MASKLALIVAALAAVALFLSGCGSGPGGKSHECSNEQFQLKTQSYTGKVTATVTINDLKQTSSGTQGMKLDMEKLNVREDATTSVTVQVNGTDISETITTKAFLSAENKLAAVAVNGKNADGKTMSTCTYFDLSNVSIFKDPEHLKMIIQTGVAAIAAEMKCTGNDGTYDTFVLDEKQPNPNNPMPVPLPKGFSAEVKETVQVTSDYMLHSVSLVTDATTPVVNGTTIPATKTHEDVQFTVDGGAAKPTGPSSDDLTYDSWGKCVEFKPKSSPTSLKVFFEASRSEALHHMFGELKVQFHDSPSAFLLRAIDEHLQRQSQPMSSMVV